MRALRTRRPPPTPCFARCVQVVGRDVLFRGLRVRMSVATGSVDMVRLHSVTQRAEYVGEVLRKVQAVGETPQGGQVRPAGRCCLRGAALAATLLHLQPCCRCTRLHLQPCRTRAARVCR